MRHTLFLLFMTSMVARAVPIYLTNSQNQLLRSDTDTPGSVFTSSAISGLQSGENVLGIDFRPATGQLFALGSSSRLYTLNLSSGAATQVGAAGAFALSGNSYGFDFNPTVDRIRVVSDAGQNLRLNPIDGTLTATDGMLNGAAMSLNGSGYTNSVDGATSTTLFGIDSASGQLYTQNPPNNGTLVPVGSLGVTPSANVGFDIAFPGNAAFAALQVGGVSSLYSINLSTGAASNIGAIGGNQTIIGLALAPVPEPSTMLFVALGAGLAIFAKRNRSAKKNA